MVSSKLCPFCMQPAEGSICPHCGKSLNYVSSPSHLPAGFVVSGKHPYVLGAALGQGGFGITYIALDMITNIRVAIKEYFPTFCAGRTDSTVSAYPSQEEIFMKGKRRFLDEAQVLKSLSDLQSVVNVLDFFEFNNSAYLVMEFLEGSSLKAYAAKHGKFPTQRFFTQIQPMMADIERMHQRGVIHRDIAPDNIILTRDGQMKLIDFGAARSFVGDQSMTVVVKKGFAPVEQYLSKGSTACTDVYALAATIYYCITGAVPMDSAQRQYDGTPLPPPSALGADILPHQERALEKALEIQAKDRTQSIAELADALCFQQGTAGNSQPRLSGQYEILKCPGTSIQENCPVFVKLLNLIYDYDRNTALLQPVLVCLTNDSIHSITAELYSELSNGSYLFLARFDMNCENVKLNDVFSEDIPIILPPGDIRKLQLSIISINYANGDKLLCNKNGEPVFQQESLNSFLGNNADLLQQYKLETTSQAAWKPAAGQYHWQCTCGCLNLSANTACTRCGTDRILQLDALNPETLAANAEARKAEEARIREEKRKKIIQWTVKIVSVAAILVLLLTVVPWSINQLRYNAAVKKMEAGEFEAASQVFLELETFKDSPDKARYAEAEALLADEKYEEAIRVFDSLGDYSDSKERVLQISYQYGQKLYDTGKYDQAYDILIELDGYENSRELAQEACYLYAGELTAAEKYHEAYVAYYLIPGYKDSAELGLAAEYQYATICADSKLYQDSIDAFTRLEDYKDSPHQLLSVKYAYANQLMDDSMWTKAADLYEELNDYKESRTQYKEARYQYGVQLINDKEYKDAVSIFEELKSYKKSKDKLNEAKYQYALLYKNNKNVTTFEYLKALKKAKYKDSADLYDDLFSWKVTLVAVNSNPNDYTTKADSVNKNVGYLHFQFKLEGGGPGERINVTHTVVWPGGSTSKSKWHWEKEYSGSQFGCEWDNGPYHGYRSRTGTLTIKVYNKDTKEYLGKGSIKLTK